MNEDEIVFPPEFGKGGDMPDPCEGCKYKEAQLNQTSNDDLFKQICELVNDWEETIAESNEVPVLFPGGLQLEKRISSLVEKYINREAQFPDEDLVEKIRGVMRQVITSVIETNRVNTSKVINEQLLPLIAAHDVQVRKETEDSIYKWLIEMDKACFPDHYRNFVLEAARNHFNLMESSNE